MRKFVNRLLGSLQWAALSLVPPSYATDACPVGAIELPVRLRVEQVVRQSAPRELFGFNVPWRDFQIAYFRNGAVRQEVVDWLQPFEGALYRYPGGTPSNWFEWRKATGPREARGSQVADYDRAARVDFGFEEFGRFLEQVRGRALMTLNLSGVHKRPLPPSEVEIEAVRMVRAVSATPGLRCGAGGHCPVVAWELGNEMDAPPHRWSGAEYASRAAGVVAAVSSETPGLTWIAHGRSAPWEKRAADYPAFNAEVAQKLARSVSGVAIHPYYDGIPVSHALRYVSQYADSWLAVRADAQVYVTEHGRWPAVPPVGKWQDNWYQATGLGGAISTADFLLGLVPDRRIAAANWHALSGDGPWQLFRWVREPDQLVATPVYWAMRTLREAYLDDVVKLDYAVPQGASYYGGYDVRLVGMRSADGSKVSILGVNRSNGALRLNLVGSPAGVRSGQFRVVTGRHVSEDNSRETPHLIEMASSRRSLSQPTAGDQWCVPPRAVFSISLT